MLKASLKPTNPLPALVRRTRKHLSFSAIQPSSSSKIMLKHTPGWALGYLETKAGRVLQVATRPILADMLDLMRSRLIKHRERIRVAPGLYAIGSPTPASPILVTANYKPSFDSVRFGMWDQSAWLLVLDTKGVNVWCAAGKGTFGNAELLVQVQAARLELLAPEAPLILPQLGTVGISAWKIAQRTHRRIYIGPILAKDLPSFIIAGFKASETQRRMRFGLKDRALLIPRELVANAPLFAVLLIPAFLLAWPSGFSASPEAWRAILVDAFLWWLAPAGGILSGLVLTPLLLPYLPGHFFSVKGASIGLLWGVLWLFALDVSPLNSTLGLLSATLLSSWLSALFTGSSPYTSLSGVQRELRFAIPAYLATAVLGGLGLIAKIASILLGGSI